MAGDFYIDAKLVGLEEVRDFLNDLAKADLRDRLREAAKLVSDTAKDLTHSRRVRAAMSYDVRVKSANEWRAVVGPLAKKAFFAHFLEFGTKASRRHHATRAFPFLMPAEEQTEERVVDIVGQPFLLRGTA